jgi:hypothetical protein
LLAGTGDTVKREMVLASDQVRVEQVDGEGSALLDGLGDLNACWVLRIGQCPLPHADIAGGDVEVAGL